MKKLIRRTDHPVRYWAQKAAACILLVILLGASSVLALNSEARAAFIGWIREAYETHFTYHYFGKTRTIPEDMIYCPAWMPDGYVAVSKFIDDTQVNIVYENENRELAFFSYAGTFDSLTLQIGRDGHELSQTVYVGNTPADLYIDQDTGESNILIWTDANSRLVFWISAQFNSSELVKIAESVRMIKKKIKNLSSSV